MTGLLVPLLLLGICALAVYVLALPFRGARRARASSAPQPLQSSPDDTVTPAPSPAREMAMAALLDEKDRLFQALADLRFDFEAGKISAEDFAEEDGRLRARAARILAELDAADSSAAPAPPGPRHDRSRLAPNHGSP